MQILGIYLYEDALNQEEIHADARVVKNLKKGWYPFGNISDCSKIFDKEGNINEDEYLFIKKELEEKQGFTNRLYEIDSSEVMKENISNPLININCIVGKNGSGKSTLVSLEYRIINNLACVIKNFCPLINVDYRLTWASGFNADLFYELAEEIYCIRITDNIKFSYNESQAYGIGKALLFGKNVRFNEICTKLKEINKKYDDCIETIDITLLQENKLLEYYEEVKTPITELSKYLFYTIGVNYSLYTNSIVYDSWNDTYEYWLSNIYHKNDAYFTPIVLVPYKKNGSEINVEKEKNLAKERISTLSLLQFSENNNEFIEDLIPSSIEYSLMDIDDYQTFIKRKYIHSFSNDVISDEKDNYSELYDDVVKNLNLSVIIPLLKRKWEETLFSNEKETEYKKLLGKKWENIFNIIKINTLEYLVYKTIKICIYYDEYKKYFENIGFVGFSKRSLVFFEKKISLIISNFISDNVKIDFINLKIIQCIQFLKNLDFYIKKSHSVENIHTTSEREEVAEVFHRYVYSLDFVDNFNDAKKYDDVFINLPSAIFRKEFFYKNKQYKGKKNRNNERSQAVLSSGESQLLNSLSYVVYHIKNAASNQSVDGRIKYRNYNLVFDEAELYYHPEYQQRFINDLLGILRRSNLSKIVESINITIITHSPFMLSDVPNANVLSLQPNNESNNTLGLTLGANYYDLIKEHFFMTSYIGTHTEKIIKQFVKIYHNEHKLSLKEKEFYEVFIKNIGDEFLMSTLKNMFNEITKKSFKESLIEQYEEKIKQLRNMDEEN